MAMAQNSETDSRHVPAFKLLLSCPSGLSPSQVSVLLDQVYDRIPHPDISLENSISEIWDCRVQQNPYMFNGLKFRLRCFSSKDGDNCIGAAVHYGAWLEPCSMSSNLELQHLIRTRQSANIKILNGSYKE